MNWLDFVIDLLGLIVAGTGFVIARRPSVRWLMLSLGILWMVLTLVETGAALMTGVGSPIRPLQYATVAGLAVTLLIQSVLIRLDHGRRSYRDDLACDIANLALTHIATEHYRRMIRGSIRLGMSTALDDEAYGIVSRHMGESKKTESSEERP
ncbi:hypothetical protein [Bifidobacterium sp. SO1]|uniref:hypothetical protein n=1 Tax=Bifidobacterium sp. SO1 TaxID=2809029 RepID=UPI001BDC7A43|nr:hypothetical protein [Bifidobacterium sp. SO1]MBT1162168.1 hypothetical protein [Bifidobacterium sp. SO1]